MKNILLMTILCSISCQPQISSPKIIGKWVETKRTLLNGDTGEKITFDKKPYSPDMKIEFFRNGTGTDHRFDEIWDFSFKDSLLIIGVAKYKVEVLTDSNLIYVKQKKGFLRHYFRKVQRF